MRRLLLLLLFPSLACAQVPIGGATGIDLPTATKALTVANSTFSASLASWTANACATWDGTHTHTADGTGSAKMVNCGAGSVDVLTQTIVADQTGFTDIVIPFWMKADNAFNGTVFAVLVDNTHGGVSMIGVDGKSSTQIGPAIGAETDWVLGQTQRLYSVYLHGGDTILLKIRVVGQTAGTLWVDEIGFQESFYPLSCFVKSPNYRGYLYAGDSQVVTGVCEFSSLSSSNSGLTIKFASVAGCGSGVLATLTPSIVVPVTAWSQDLTGLTTQDVPIFVCFSATVNSGGGAVAVTYHDWKIIPKSAAFKTGQVNTLSADGAWLHNFGSGQVRTIVHGAYDSFSGTNRTATGLWATGSCEVPQASAKLCYETNINSMGNQLPASLVKEKNSALFADYKAVNYNTILNINTLSGVNPTSGSDQLTPYLAAMTDNGMTHIQIMNNMFGSIVTGGIAPGAPTFASGNLAQTTGGTLVGPNVYVFIGELTASPGISATKPVILETKASATGTFTLSGGNNAIITTFPACDPGAIGFYIYAAQGASPPASYTAFRRQFSTIWFDCSTPTATLTSIIDSGDPPNVLDITTITRAAKTLTVNTTQSTAFIIKEPNFTISGVTSAPNNDFNGECDGAVAITNTQFTCTMQTGTDTSGTGGLANADQTPFNNRPAWQAAITDTTANASFATAMFGNTGAFGFYHCDECLGLDPYRVKVQRDQLGPASNDIPTMCVPFAESLSWDAIREMCDIVGSDPYIYGVGGTSDARWSMPLGDRACTVYNTSDATIVNNFCDTSWVDTWSEIVTRRVFASRPVITVVQNFERGGARGYIYAEQRKQIYKAILGCLIYGGHGCGVMLWKHGDSSGTEDMWYKRLNRQFYTDMAAVFSEITALSPIFLSTTFDSSAPSPLAGFSTPGVGALVTAVTMNSAAITQAATNTVCGYTGNWTNGQYANMTNYPFGPVRFTVHQPNGNATVPTIVATNLCTAASSFTVTFSVKQSTLPSVNTGVSVLYENRVLPLTCSAGTCTFTDTWQDFDVHVYQVDAPSVPPAPAPTQFNGMLSAIIH